jgi:hypothetical protein
MTLPVSIGLPKSISLLVRGIPSGTLGKVALFSGGSAPHCSPPKLLRGLSSTVWLRVGGDASGRSRALIPGRRPLGWEGRAWVGTEGRLSDSGSCCVYAGGGARCSCCMLMLLQSTAGIGVTYVEQPSSEFWPRLLGAGARIGGVAAFSKS